MRRDRTRSATTRDGLTVTLRPGRTKNGVRARLLGPLGAYPTAVVGDPDHGYLFDPAASITLVRVTEHAGQYDAYSEMDWAYPEEIAFFASMALADGRNGRPVSIYPLPDAYDVTLSADVALNSPELLRTVQDMMVKEILSSRRRHRRRFPGACSFLSYDLPPFASKRRPYFGSDGMDPDRQAAVLAAVNPSDFLMIRGLSTWIRSSMLAAHLLFIEEAITTLFISMEASFRLVRRRLMAEGIANPSSKDAAVLVGKAFSEQPLERYFAEHYDNRIAALHPESRLGIFLHPPLMADDFFHLHGSLRDLYVYLLTGKVDDLEFAE